MAVDSSLVFFNNCGDYLNFSYDNSSDMWSGNMIFPLNSSDTFKTIGLYMFENVQAFQYQDPGVMYLQKFQLFNQYDVHVRGATYSGLTQSITMIEPAVIDSSFYSKWIYGNDFEALYPIGTKIQFNYPLLEFTNLNIPYTIIQSKKGAVLILSNQNNQTFQNNYGTILGLTSTYATASISSINTIGIYNYVGSDLISNLSAWNEYDFYDNLFVEQKLNLVNFDENGIPGDSINFTPNIPLSVVTVNNATLPDDVYSRYDCYAYNLPDNTPLTIELILKDSLPVLYSGGMDITSSTNIITFLNPFDNVYLRPGNVITLYGSILNTLDYTISNLSSFSGTNALTYYATSSQVTWNNQIFQCVQGYTQGATSGISPNNTTYWTNDITYIPINEPLNNETILNGQIYLTTNKLYFTQSFTQSGTVSIALGATAFGDDFANFGINLYFNNVNRISAELQNPGQYAIVNYYAGLTPGSYSIGSSYSIYEKVIGIEENLTSETNENISANYQYRLLFNAIDEFGIILTINNLIYQQSAIIFYELDGITIDIPRSVDATLRAWLTSYYSTLVTLGIIPILAYLGNYISPYFNAIILNTEYPNVPIAFSVEVGTEAIFYVNHSSVLFYDMGGYLNITINGISYGQATVFISPGVPNIPITLDNWISSYQLILEPEGVLVSNINNLLEFNIAQQSTLINYTIQTGQSTLPGTNQYRITTLIPGNLGCLITSNQIVLPNTATYSFEEAGFATGMITSINNSFYTYNNQQYNILYLNPYDMVLSYQGPFWGTASICNSSAFATIAFSLGFGSTGCTGSTGSATSSGGWNFLQFSNAFDIFYSNSNTYTTNTYNGINNMVDILYLQLSQDLYILGDGILVLDGFYATEVSNIYLGSSTGSSIELEFNTYNNYLYALTEESFYVVDPLLYSIVNSVSLSLIPTDLEINSYNGDVYVSYATASKVDIFDMNSNFITSIPTSGSTEKMAYNSNENTMYVSQNNGIVSKINGVTRLLEYTYTIPGLTYSIFYQNISESIYVVGTNMYEIQSNIVTPISISGSYLSNDMIFNNLTGYFYFSQGFGSSNFTEMNVLNNAVQYQTTNTYGNMALNQYDGCIYVAGASASVSVVNPIYGNTIQVESFTSSVKDPIYDPLRQSVWVIQPGANTINEIQVTVNSTINVTENIINNYFNNQLGTLSPYYQPYADTWLSTRDFLRYPRENFTGGVTVSFYYTWANDQVPDIFLYDFSGNQLQPYMGNPSYSYIGSKPLSPAWINNAPNSNLSLVNQPESQQTVFPIIINQLEFIDSTTDVSSMPSPLEVFIGFNSPNEGPIGSVLQLFRSEPISLLITTNSTNNNIITFGTMVDTYGNIWTQISLNQNSTNVFTLYPNNTQVGFNPGQLLQLSIIDVSNTTNQYISPNNGKVFEISQVYTRYILLTASYTGDIITNETTVINNYPTTGSTTYTSVTFSVIDKQIGTFNILGQTEIEDIRYKIELTNVGKNITPNEAYIFESSDVNEQGTDWVFLNQKRKEMLIVRHEIFPYVGSYKAIVNAINFWGYNDLELNEYYKNISPTSSNYGMLYPVPIQDIFNTQVVGFTTQDSIITTLPNPVYESTNLLNLTYPITDIDGNNTLDYTFQEIILKLNGLKNWLQTNVIPLPFEIYDITGDAYFPAPDYLIHRNYSATFFNMTSNMTPINFNVNRAYLLPISSGSSIYNINIDFNYGSTSSFSIMALNDNVTVCNLPDYFDIRIRTYKTYNQWQPFVTYDIGDEINYYGLIYQSAINNNNLNDPRINQNSPQWNPATNYTTGNLTIYESDLYIYIGTQSSFMTQSYTASVTILPPDINSNFLDITIWRTIKLQPVQTLTEMRNMSITLSCTQSFQFTLDANIDPFLSIEVSSHDGHSSYTSQQNYQIIGNTILSSNASITTLLPIGPFTPINNIT